MVKNMQYNDEYIHVDEAHEHIFANDNYCGDDIVGSIEHAISTLKSTSEHTRDYHRKWAREIVNTLKDAIEGGDLLKDLGVQILCPRCEMEVIR
jgi:hypothetical protein